mmetsp:Transcript_32641/g.45510  ORF Transcript_32641/g.45510 Transcript_32641/m.45510 type:complete len:256 (+) Transcript_32641:308-1075(+)
MLAPVISFSSFSTIESNIFCASTLLSSAALPIPLLLFSSVISRSLLRFPPFGAAADRETPSSLLFRAFISRSPRVESAESASFCSPPPAGGLPPKRTKRFIHRDSAIAISSPEMHPIAVLPVATAPPAVAMHIKQSVRREVSCGSIFRMLFSHIRLIPLTASSSPETPSSAPSTESGNAFRRSSTALPPNAKAIIILQIPRNIILSPPRAPKACCAARPPAPWHIGMAPKAHPKTFMKPTADATPGRVMSRRFWG